ncbi:MAG: sulfatase, partial [Prolixibacteraceae bacterium]
MMHYLKLLKRLVFLLLFGFAALICRSEEQPEKPNIIWLNCEDLSPMLGAYGDEYATTPNLDQLAKEGVLYQNAYAPAPICAPARSCMITGVYATSLGTQHLRSELERPEFVKTVPEYLKQAGYFTTNYAKTDYNFDPSGLYDYWKQDLAPWRARPEGDESPFFSFFVFGMTHEGSGNNLERYNQSVKDLPESLFHDPGKAKVPPYYPDTPELRELWAHYYDCATALDRTVGQVVQNLKEDGLYENTVIIFFADHGNGMPRYKRWLNNSGLHVPFIVYVPEKYRHLMKDKPGSENADLINFSDLAPTTLNLAGVELPDHLQGIPFMGEKTGEPRKYMAAARSRADNMYEVSRAVRDDRYIYVRHYMPHMPYIQPGYIFSDKKLSFKYLRAMHEEGTLPPESEKMWHPKPVEELYDLRDDPFELNNLAQNSEFQNKKEELKQ